MTAEALPLMDPYSTVAGMWASLPDWMSEEDARRITSYQVYEQIYWNVPDTFKLVQRGTDALPIYIPNARTLIDTSNRYIGNGMSFIVDPDVSQASDQLAFQNALTNLFRRERFFAKWNSNKRYLLIRGDMCFHVMANPLKPPGRRIRIDELDPASYFPVTNPNDPDQIIAVHIVETIMIGDDQFLKRQTYTRGADPLNNDGSDTSIWNSVALYAMDSEWQKLDTAAETVIKPPTQLPPDIKAIPVYHFKNIETPGDPFGSSELRGLERIMAAINQAISDEELALALEGLGMYSTDAGPPKDEAGNTVNWRLGPGRVVERPAGTSFDRVDGIGSVTPYMDHLGFLIKSLKEASATPDIAIGAVDVAVAESGVARIMQMGPMLSKADERETGLADTLAQFMYDMRDWLAAYEQFSTAAYAVPVFGEKLPDDRTAKIKEILDIVAAGIASAEWGREELVALGYVFPEDEGAKLTKEAQARTFATDAWIARAAGELEMPEGGGNGQAE